jgi:alkyl hydroperoxide reductase 1
MGTRAARLAMVLDDLKVTYLGVEEVSGVTVSGADAVLEHL